MVRTNRVAAQLIFKPQNHQIRNQWYGGLDALEKSAWKKSGHKINNPAKAAAPMHSQEDLFPHPEVSSTGVLDDGTPRSLLTLKRLEALGEKKAIPKAFVEDQGGIQVMTYDYSTPPAAFPEHAGGNEGIHENMIDIFRTQNTLKEPEFLGICTYRGLIGVLFFGLGSLWIWNVMGFGREVALFAW